MEVEIEKVVDAQKEAQSAAEIAGREEQIARNKESRAQVIAMEVARMIAGAEGHQQKDAQEIIQLERDDLNRSQRSDRLAM